MERLKLSHAPNNLVLNWTRAASGGGRGGVTPIYGLYRYVPQDRVWFLRFSILNKAIIFAHVGLVFPV